MTSLRRRAQDNVPTASYWLRRVLDDDGRRDYIDKSIAQGVPGAESAVHYKAYLVVLEADKRRCRSRRETS